MTKARLQTPELCEDLGNGQYRLNLHRGQYHAMTSNKRFPVISAGTQSGKTSLAPFWLSQEIERCGPGDYLMLSATYDLFKLKALPEMYTHFRERLGWKYHSGDRVFTKKIGSQEWRIILRSADAPGGLESTTAMAAVFDEPGQLQIPRQSNEALRRRLTLHKGRCLYMTTLYAAQGWFITDVLMPAMGGDPLYDLIQFPSYWNPMFDIEEYKLAKKTLPPYKFDLFYRGIMTRPSGMIYDVWNDWDRALIKPCGECAPCRARVRKPCINGQRGHLVEPFSIPPVWERVVGVDPGLNNTAIVWIAINPDWRRAEPLESPHHPGLMLQFYIYRESIGGSKTQAEWATACNEYKEPVWRWWGGTASEEETRIKWRQAGIPLLEPLIHGLEAGIDHTYGLMKQDRLGAFSTATGTRGNITTYSRELDKAGEPLEKIANKETFHFNDGLRYADCAFEVFTKDPLPEDIPPEGDRARTIWEFERERAEKVEEQDAYDDYR